MTRGRPCALATLLVLLIAPVWAQPVYGPGHIDAVAQLIEARLALMPAVAQYKHAHDLPIEDSAREAVVLEAATQAALRFGLAPDSVRPLFRAQIEAAKAIQQLTPAAPAGIAIRDLHADLRPALGRIGTQLNAALAVAVADLPQLAETLPERLTHSGVPAAHAAAIGAALAGVRPAAPTLTHGVLDHLRARGVLRVGTTGDYAPFSERTADGGFRGIDIDLAADLAASLDVDLLLVPTTWPTLLADLAAGRFDIGMSGISRRLFRARDGLLSAAYHTGGKAPVSRCADAAGLAELDQLNRPEVHVLVNPGGTNERFVRTYLPAARVTVIDDNLDIFARLAAGEGDVMITDQIEIRLQTRRLPTLCATRTEPFNHQTKGYLVGRDPVWLAYVDLWLEERRADGTLEATFSRHLAPDRDRR